jgi:hypothetical protein
MFDLLVAPIESGRFGGASFSQTETVGAPRGCEDANISRKGC